MSRPTIADVRKIMGDVRVRATPAEKEKAFNLIRELLDTSGVVCPMCGWPMDWRDATHIRTGYREPHIRPYKPGSWLDQRDNFHETQNGDPT